MNRLSQFAPALAVAALSLLAGCGPNLFNRMQGRNFGFCGLIILVLDVIAIVEIINSNRTTGDKVLWAAIVFFFPVGGLLLYYFVGKKR